MLLKIDRRLLPVLALLYLIAQVDRSNISNARIEGLEVELGISSTEWSLVLMYLLHPHMFLGESMAGHCFASGRENGDGPEADKVPEVPSNMAIKHCKRPSRYISPMVIVLGSHHDRACLRSGLLQPAGAARRAGHVPVRDQPSWGRGTSQTDDEFRRAGFFPGAVYLLSTWYMPQQLAVRVALFHVTGTMSGAFSGLLAASVARLGGTMGLSGWRWIFLVDGIATVVMGILCFFLLIDSPETSQRWLEAEEMRLLEVQRLVKEGGKIAEGREKRSTKEKAKDKAWRICAACSWTGSCTCRPASTSALAPARGVCLPPSRADPDRSPLPCI